MNFVQFARAHGIEIGDLIASDYIRRCATIDKPRSKNGAYFWDGQREWVFNWSGEASKQWYEDPTAKPGPEADNRSPCRHVDAQRGAWDARLPGS